MKRIILIILLLGIGCTVNVGAQSVSALKKQQNEALKNIKDTNIQLTKTQKSQMRALHKLESLSTEISHMRDSISALNKEVESIASRERALTSAINNLEQDLEKKKKSYAKAIQSMVIRRDSHFDALMFIFSAASLEQAYRRFRYLQEFSAWRKQEAKDIARQRDELELQRDTLTQLRGERNKVLGQRTRASQKLSQQKKQQQTLVAGLKKKEKDLKRALAKHQKQADELARRIEEIIQAEARKSAQASQSKGKSSISTQGYKMSQDELVLSRNFAQNRGKLPTPLSGRYRIISRFGTQQHPDLKYVKINNQGIDLQTIPGTNARAVFDGVVTAVFVVPGYNTTVIVRHGEYLTVYSNLCKIFVKKGDKVSTRQDLGLIYSDPEEDNRTVLHFQLRKNEITLNPESWLKQ